MRKEVLFSKLIFVEENILGGMKKTKDHKKHFLKLLK